MRTRTRRGTPAITPIYHLSAVEEEAAEQEEEDEAEASEAESVWSVPESEAWSIPPIELDEEDDFVMITCQICGEEGHGAQECPTLAGTTSTDE